MYIYYYVEDKSSTNVLISAMIVSRNKMHAIEMKIPSFSYSSFILSVYLPTYINEDGTTNF